MAIGDDQDIFDSAMNDAPPANEPAVETNEPPPAPEAPAEGGQPRDPATGQFAKKDGATPPPDPAQAPPAAVTAQEPAATPPAPVADHRIPLAEHLSEREKRQAAERRAEELERRLADQERRQREAAQRPQDPPPDPWADPNAAINHGVREAVSPLQQQMEQQRLGFSQLLASEKFGAQTVETALHALAEAVRTDPGAQFEHQRIMAAAHPYAELVAWHQRQTALKEIGTDPNAYKAKVLEEAKKDPAFVAAIIEAARGQAQQPPPAGQPRSPTTVVLPPSLNRTPGAGGQALPANPRTDAEIHKDLFPT